jgi:DNA-binding GntR family transcriptional regulator
MSPEPVTAERIYHNLKQDIITGRHRPGTLLNLQRLADEFGISVSPVRDAIHRMVGERLIGAHPGGGFELPILTPETLRDLYSWNDQLLRYALRTSLPDVNPEGFEIAAINVQTPDAMARLAAALFCRTAKASRNVELIEAVSNTSDRLYLARMKEPGLISSTGEELGNLATLARNGPVAAVRAAIREYHRRRLRRVSRIAAALLA